MTALEFFDYVQASLSDQIPFDNKLKIWLRDDDAETTTPDLEKLLKLTQTYDVPLALAVIPENSSETLSQLCRPYSHLQVWQHGWNHQNNSKPGEKKCEFPEYRNTNEVKKQWAEGAEKLSHMFEAQWCPVFVPPWNRLPPVWQELARVSGYSFVSAYGERKNAYQFNTHFDIMDWKGSRSLLSYQSLKKEWSRALKISLDEQVPLGLLTHHLVHDEKVWEFLNSFLKILANHEKVEFSQNELPGHYDSIILFFIEPIFNESCGLLRSGEG